MRSATRARVALLLQPDEARGCAASQERSQHYRCGLGSDRDVPHPVQATKKSGVIVGAAAVVNRIGGLVRGDKRAMERQRSGIDWAIAVACPQFSEAG